MPKLREMLDVLSLDELRVVTQLARLPHSGNKQDLIRKLTSGLDEYSILENLGNRELQKILRYYGQPTSGTKDALIERVFHILSPEKVGTKEGTKKKCEVCEHLYDERLLERHHFMPKAMAGKWVGGTILLGPTCHRVLTRALENERKKKDRDLLDDEVKRVFNRTRGDVQAGKYGAYGRK